MRKFKEFILPAAALLVVMLTAVLAGCSNSGYAQDRTTGSWDFDLPIDAEPAKKAEFSIGKVQDWDKGEDLQSRHSITGADQWILQTRVQLGFSLDTVSTSRQGESNPSWFDHWTKRSPSVMEESNSFCIPLGRSETGDYVYALPRVRFWFE